MARIMEVKITGSAEEIAALIAALQGERTDDVWPKISFKGTSGTGDIDNLSW